MGTQAEDVTGLLDVDQVRDALLRPLDTLQDVTEFLGSELEEFDLEIRDALAEWQIRKLRSLVALAYSVHHTSRLANIELLRLVDR